MIDTLKIFTKDNYFFIESDCTDFTNLRITNSTGTHSFTHAEKTLWFIDSKEIASLLTPHVEDRINIYYGDQDNQIDTKNFNIHFSDSVFTEYNEQMIYLYITLDHKLRFMWNQKPSSKSFYANSKIKKIDVQDEKVNLELVLFSNYVPLKNMSLIISNRQNGEKFKIDSTSCIHEQTSINEFKNYGTFCFTIQESFLSLLNEYNYNDYDSSIFDFWVNFRISPFPVTEPLLRVQYSKEIDQEVWIPYSKSNMFMLNPYSTVHDNISVRTGILKKEAYDSYKKMVNEQKQLQRKKIVLITEYPYKAQDNGYFFFKYLMQNQNKYTAYYIITPDSPDLENLQPFMSNVVFYKSKQHIELLFKSTYLAHTHTSSYAFPFISKGFLEQKQILKKLYLKHGITALKNVSFAYSKQTTPDFTNKIIASSSREKKQIHEQLGYDLDDIEITGLARFDSLLSNNHKFKSFFKRKKIIIMPTWRNELNNLSDEEFKDSLFYQRFNDLINDASFQELVRKKCLKVSLYLHSNFQKYNHLFNSKFVKTIPAGSISVQTLMKESGIMITDYSSVGLDFALQNRTVLFYQFDNDTQEMAEGVKQNDAILPGPTFQTKEALIIILENKVKNNILDKKYQDIVTKQLYTFQDTNACQRIFDVLDKM
ncbi:CDP-glycerol glycerophosphotransferase family protein [Enterococcus olivae]